jgi:hypothetical protein
MRKVLFVLSLLASCKPSSKNVAKQDSLLVRRSYAYPSVYKNVGTLNVDLTGKKN